MSLLCTQLFTLLATGPQMTSSNANGARQRKSQKKNLTNGKHLTVCSVNDLAVKRGETKRPSAEFTIRSAPPTLAAYAQRRQSRNTALNHDRFRSRGGVF